MTKLPPAIPETMSVESAPQVPWTVKDAWTGFVSFFIMFVGLGLVRGIFEKSGILYLWLLLYQPLQFVPIWIILRMRNASWKDLGFKTARPNVLALGCGFVVLAFGVNFINNIVMVLFKIPIQAEKFFGLASNLDSPTTFLIAGIFIAPLFEETIFRGFLFPGLRQKLGWEKAAIISSAIFGFCHLQIAAFIPTFVLGLVFCYLYQRSSSIWPGIILHTVVNSFGLCLLVIVAQNGGSINF
jgi:membrane protease YdiL (CAAX protease family)